MKNMKKILALVIAVMVLAASMSIAFAEDVTLTVPNDDAHAYEVYQIFTGDVDGNTLSNVHWGQNGTTKSGVVDDTTLTAVAALSTMNESQRAAALAAYADLTSTPIIANLTKDTAAADRKVAPGYYLIKDKSGVTLTDGDEYTLYIVQVLNDLTITRKAQGTTSNKTVDDVNDSDSTAALNGQRQKSSDYDIGDFVPYHLTATISEKVGLYQKYHITFEDTLEAGKFDAISDLDILIDGKTAATINADDTADYTVAVTGADTATNAGFTVTVEFTPKTNKTLAALASKNITIDFSAQLGTGAAYGTEGNRNELVLKYSNNPNDSDGSDEGEIPKKEVITFTYRVLVNKVDQNNNALGNAGFTLYKVSKADAEAGVPAANNGDAASRNAYWASKALADGTWEDNTPSATKTSFSFNGIDDGYYVLCETTTPSGYNTIDPQVFFVTGTHDPAGLTLTDLTGTALTGSDIVFTKDTGEGSLTASIQNNQGTTLPSTGGIGTTLFYVGGGILVLAAVILLVTKRRMNAND